MPFANAEGGIADAGNLVYIVGGKPSPSKNTAMYNKTSNTWLLMKMLDTPRRNKPCVFLNKNKLCVAGGWYQPVQWLMSMECLQIDSNTVGWQASDQMPYSVGLTSCATMGSSIILTGGYNSNSLKSVLQWNEEDGWVSLASMVTRRNQHCTVSDNTRYVYVVGGKFNDNAMSSVERYDTTNDIWGVMAPIPVMLERHACVYINDTIVVTGGFNQLKEIYLYSVKLNTWTRSSTDLLQGTHDHTMAILP